VRFRITGALTKHIDLDKNVTTLVANRIKGISGLDSSEKRVPQDGRTQVTISGKTLDVRVSVLPTYYGERIVMRILMQSENIPSLEELGFREELTEEFYKLLNLSSSMSHVCRLFLPISLSMSHVADLKKYLHLLQYLTNY